MASSRILIVDDEGSVRSMLSNLLEEEGCEVRVAESAEAGLAMLKRFDPAVAIVDIVLPGMDGLEFLSRIKQVSPDTEVLIITGHTSAERAFKAIRQGAYDYLEKPFNKIADVWITTQRAIEKRRLTRENRALMEEQERRSRDPQSSGSPGDPPGTRKDPRPLSELLDYFAGLIAQKLDVDRVSLLLLDERTNELSIAASRGITGVDAASVRIRLGEGIAGTVARSGEVLMVTNPATDLKGENPSYPELSNSAVSASILLCIPIKSENRILGVINITSRRSGTPFSTDDLIYLTGLAGQIAAAIEGTRRSNLLQTA